MSGPVRAGTGADGPSETRGTAVEQTSKNGADSPERAPGDASESREQSDKCLTPGLIRGKNVIEQTDMLTTNDRAGADDLSATRRDVIEQNNKNNLITALSVTQVGMSVTAEVKTGTRSVISYILSPIAKATSEAGRER